MLTKEECNEALDWLYALSVSCNEEVYEHRSLFVGEKCNLIKQLINEHFENPPLKFEELKEGMWVWDNQLKWFFKVVICNVKVEGYESLKMFKVENYEGGSTLTLYEPNRFYRKEVL